jgi:hypothetical protein
LALRVASRVTRQRVTGIALASAAGLAFVVGAVLHLFPPGGNCAPPAQELCRSEAQADLFWVVQGMFLLGFVLVLVGLVMVWFAPRRDATGESDGAPDRRVERSGFEGGVRSRSSPGEPEPADGSRAKRPAEHPMDHSTERPTERPRGDAAPNRGSSPSPPSSPPSNPHSGPRPGQGQVRERKKPPS